jgi:RNA polymerase sigma-70 factor (ECF subfamily)
MSRSARSAVHSNFPTTRWSLVVRAGSGRGADGRNALAELLQQYLAPMRGHLINRKGVPPQDADDLLQAFLADRVLEDGLVASAVQSRGRFRSFLLTALDHFVLNHFRALRARKRSPKGCVMSMEEVCVVDPTTTADEAFDVAWARQVIELAVAEVREECRVADRPDVWGVFEARILRPSLEATEPTPYGELLERFGFASPAQASNILVTGNRMFRRALRAVVGRYEASDEEVDAELTDLRRLLGRGGARSA